MKEKLILECIFGHLVFIENNELIDRRLVFVETLKLLLISTVYNKYAYKDFHKDILAYLLSFIKSFMLKSSLESVISSLNNLYFSDALNHTLCNVTFGAM